MTHAPPVTELLDACTRWGIDGAAEEYEVTPEVVCRWLREHPEDLPEHGLGVDAPVTWAGCSIPRSNAPTLREVWSWRERIEAGESLNAIRLDVGRGAVVIERALALLEEQVVERMRQQKPRGDDTMAAFHAPTPAADSPHTPQLLSHLGWHEGAPTTNTIRRRAHCDDPEWAHYRHAPPEEHPEVEVHCRTKAVYWIEEGCGWDALDADDEADDLEVVREGVAVVQALVEAIPTSEEIAEVAATITTDDVAEQLAEDGVEALARIEELEMVLARVAEAYDVAGGHEAILEWGEDGLAAQVEADMQRIADHDAEVASLKQIIDRERGEHQARVLELTGQLSEQGQEIEHLRARLDGAIEGATGCVEDYERRAVMAERRHVDLLDRLEDAVAGNVRLDDETEDRAGQIVRVVERLVEVGPTVGAKHRTLAKDRLDGVMATLHEGLFDYLGGDPGMESHDGDALARRVMEAMIEGGAA